MRFGKGGETPSATIQICAHKKRAYYTAPIFFPYKKALLKELKGLPYSCQLHKLL